MLHYKGIILPSNLLFHKSKFLITSRKDIIQPSVFPIPIQKIYDFFPCEADSYSSDSEGECPLDNESERYVLQPRYECFKLLEITLFSLTIYNSATGDNGSTQCSASTIPSENLLPFFFTSHLLQYIVKQTNQFALECMGVETFAKWTQVTVEEL